MDDVEEGKKGEDGDEGNQGGSARERTAKMKERTIQRRSVSWKANERRNKGRKNKLNKGIKEERGGKGEEKKSEEDAKK